jgi:uncharacterized protein
MFDIQNNSTVRALVAGFLAIVILFFVAKTINEFRESAYIGKDVPVNNVISVSGKGEAVDIPDLVIFSYTVTEEGATVAAAQKKATDKTNKALAFLKESGIEDKDVKTIGYNVQPQYDYTQGICTQYSCPPGKQILRGYQVTQSIEVKVHDITKAGEILSGIGALGVQNVSGLTFTFDDEDKLKNEARNEAITDAKAKAEILAKQLNVKLVRIISFNESADYPMYYERAMSSDTYGKGGVANIAAPAPSVPAGENKVISNVNITYEIR